MSESPRPNATRALARGLLRDAVAAGSPALVAAFERRYGQLRGRLVDLVGPLGFATLFNRALHLARVAHPALGAIGLEPARGDEDRTGRVHGVHAFGAAHTPAETEAALTAILVEFGALLCFFIGEDLALRVLREAWPTAADGEDELRTEAER